jgi:outer membrane immunogenic protein
MNLGWAAELARSVPESRMKRFLTAAAFTVAAAAPAWSADLPQPAPPPAAYVPVTAPVYNWGGVYFGVNGGYGFGNSEWLTNGASTGTFNVSGFLGGATLGANIQFDAFVLGIDGDLDASWFSGITTNCTPVSCETKNSWLATARARAGYAVDRVLFYGTAGGAFGNIEGNTLGTTFQNTTKAGWTAGAGIEAAFTDNWTARVEYLFIDLQNGTLPTILGTIPATPGTTTVKFDASLIRLGVDYKFR